MHANEIDHIKLEFPDHVWIDKFGQNKNTSWSGKVADENSLIKLENKELATLNASKKDYSRDEFQAWKAEGARRATGFFRVEKIGDRWWFIAPTGRLYYSLGLDCLGAGAHTVIDKAKRKYYEWLPASKSEFADGYDKSGQLSFYVCNLIRKYKKDWTRKFEERGLRRCIDWSFTGTGNWSEKLPSFPYVSMGPPMWELKNVTYIDGDIADPFEANFESEALRVASKMSSHKNDKYLVGYFLDNEMPWWNLASDVLALKPSQPCRKYWISHLQKEYGNITNLCQAWKCSARSFDELRWSLKPSQKAESDMKVFRRTFAERFYSGWYKAMKSADPNHLILGSRIAAPSDDIVIASAKYTDVLSFNHYDYSLSKDFDRYYKMTAKPILIGEFAFDSIDEGLMAAYVPVKSQKERGIAYSYYVETAASKPFIVGTHYFQYIDEPLAGRGDGENSFNGFVSVCDVPYVDLVQAAKNSNGKIYEIHSARLAPTKSKPLK